jgi:hypothetical protein
LDLSLVLGLVAPGQLLQPVPLGGSQDYRARGGNRQGKHADQQK